MKQEPEYEIARRNIKRQIKALVKMKELFISTSCGYIKCDDCIFGKELCDKLNTSYKPYMKQIDLTLLV